MTPIETTLPPIAPRIRTSPVPRPTHVPPEIKAIAKVELHQHVDGSIPVEVTWNIVRRHGLAPVDTTTTESSADQRRENALRLPDLSLDEIAGVIPAQRRRP